MNFAKDKKSWLILDKANFLEENNFFKILNNLDIGFYNTSNTEFQIYGVDLDKASYQTFQ